MRWSINHLSVTKSWPQGLFTVEHRAARHVGIAMGSICADTTQHLAGSWPATVEEGRMMNKPKLTSIYRLSVAKSLLRGLSTSVESE